MNKDMFYSNTYSIQPIGSTMPAYNLTLEQKQMWNVGADVSVAPSDCTYTVTIGDTFSDDVRIVSSESCGFTASFDTEMLPQEQVVPQAIYTGTDESNDWCLQGVPSSDQFFVSISGTKSLGEAVSDKGDSDGVPADQEAHPVVEETPRSSSDKTGKTNARFLEEARELEKRWANTGLLDDVVCGKQATAKLMESERLCNEKVQTGNHWLDK